MEHRDVNAEIAAARCDGAIDAYEHALTIVLVADSPEQAAREIRAEIERLRAEEE